jgi:hypothetical protein
MRRKTFDMIMSGGGAVLVVVLLVAGGLGLWAYSFANSNVHNQLAEQQITFPTRAAFAQAKVGTEIEPVMIPYIEKYAGEPLTTGQQAEAYADHFIAYHLAEMPYGGVYSTVSAASMAATKAAAADPSNAALATKATTLAAEVQTSFRGTTLRGLLLEAYAFWTFGQIALWASIACFVLAGIMLVLTLFGLLHFRRTPEDKEFPQLHQSEPKVLETV